MNEVQRLALEICNNRTDLSDEKKERIARMILEPSSIEHTPTPSTSSQGMESFNFEKLGSFRRASVEVDSLRMSRRFSKSRKIFGSDMCQNLGEMKRENRWPAPSTVLAAVKNKQEVPKFSRQLSTIVASRILKSETNGHASMPHENKLTPNGNNFGEQNDMHNIISADNQIIHKNLVANGYNRSVSFPRSLTSVNSSVFTPFKYKKMYTLRDVYRDLTIMRRAVSACLTTDNPSEQMAKLVSGNDNVTVHLDNSSDDIHESPSVKEHSEEEPSANMASDSSPNAKMERTLIESSNVGPKKDIVSKEAEEISLTTKKEEKRAHHSSNVVTTADIHDVREVITIQHNPVQHEATDTATNETNKSQNVISNSDDNIPDNKVGNNKQREILINQMDEKQINNNENPSENTDKITDSQYHHSGDVELKQMDFKIGNDEEKRIEQQTYTKANATTAMKQHDQELFTTNENKTGSEEISVLLELGKTNSANTNVKEKYRENKVGHREQKRKQKFKVDKRALTYGHKYDIKVKGQKLLRPDTKSKEISITRARTCLSKPIKYNRQNNKENRLKVYDVVSPTYDVVSPTSVYVEPKKLLYDNVYEDTHENGVNKEKKFENEDRTESRSSRDKEIELIGRGNVQYLKENSDNVKSACHEQKNCKKSEKIDANCLTEDNLINMHFKYNLSQLHSDGNGYTSDISNGLISSSDNISVSNEIKTKNRITDNSKNSGTGNLQKYRGKKMLNGQHKFESVSTSKLKINHGKQERQTASCVKENKKGTTKAEKEINYSKSNPVVSHMTEISSQKVHLRNKENHLISNLDAKTFVEAPHRQCRCSHRHGQSLQGELKHQNKPKVKLTTNNTSINQLSCNFSIASNHVVKSPKSKLSQSTDTTDTKIFTRNNTVIKEKNETYRKFDNYNSFNTCFAPLIRTYTQSLPGSGNYTHVVQERESLRFHGNLQTTHLRFSDTTKKLSLKMESENNVNICDKENDSEKLSSNINSAMETQGLSDDYDDDSVLNEDGLNNENDGDDKQKSRKSVMFSRNSTKSRTGFISSSALSSQTPYSDLDETERGIATDVISTLLDDVIDSVWLANVSKFKHHVCKTDDLLGEETVGCIILTDEEKQPLLSFSCKILNPATFPAAVNQYEILIGNIVEIDISDESNVREGKVRIAVPFNKANMRYFHEPVLRTYDAETNSWNSIDSFENIYFDENDSDLSVLEANINKNSIYVVIGRPTAEYITFDASLVEHDSRIDSDVTVSSPIGSRIRTDKVAVKVMVLPISAEVIADTRDSSEGDTTSLVGTSPIIILEQNPKNPQPIFVSLPCERPRMNALKSRLSSAPSPEDSGYYTQSRLSKMHDFVETWSETESHLIRIGGCDRLKCELMTFRQVSEENKVSFCVHEGKTICFVIETRKEASRPNIPAIARQLLKVLEYQRVVISVMQNKGVIQDLTVTCDLRSRYATKWRRRLEQDYDITSKIASLKEGDIVSVNLRGNLTSIGKRFQIFRFHGSQSIRINWNLQVVNKYSQKTLDFYYGFVQLLNLKSKNFGFEAVDKVEGHEWNVLLEIPVRLPKHQIGSLPVPIKTKLQVVEEGPVTLHLLSTIADCLSDQWMIVAQTLQITNARLQSLRRQNRNSDKQLVKDLLFTWFKTMPHSKEKATMLIDVLQKCGRQELAEKVQFENDQYNKERTKIATEHTVQKTLNILLKSPNIVARWKELASELGFSLANINELYNSGHTDHDRCSDMLTKWTLKGKQNWLRNLTRCVRKIGCKYVADHLLSILMKQHQLR